MRRAATGRIWRQRLTVLALGLTAFLPARAQDSAAITQPTTAPDASAPDNQSVPPELEGMQVVEKLSGQIPADLAFVDQDGRKVRLGDYFDGKHPVLLNLNYYRCPMLCGLVLNALVTGMKEMDWTAGQEFRVLTVSFDPMETPDLAHLKRQNYLRDYGRPPGAGGWDFLTGRRQPIETLLDATGFPARWDEKSKQWIHPACVIVLTPDGRISRYLYGVYFEPQTLRLSLVEASEGKIGSPVDHVLLYCFHYDPVERRYALAATNVVRAGGVLTVVVLGSVLAVFWVRERRRSKLPAAPSVSGGGPDIP